MESVSCTGANCTPVTDGNIVHLEAGDDVTCTFTNITQRGSITIVKEADPADGTRFNFFIAGIGDDLYLADGESYVMSDALPGDYDIGEYPPDGWVLDNVSCTGGDCTPITDGMTVHLDPREDITVTFSNIQIPCADGDSDQDGFCDDVDNCKLAY